MDATCEICGMVWNALDPGVNFIHGDGRWECADEQACTDRRALQRGLDAAWAVVDAAAEPFAVPWSAEVRQVLFEELP